MAQEEPINLLQYADGRLAPQNRSFPLMGLQLINGQFLFPTLVIKFDQGHGWVQGFIQEGRQQTVHNLVPRTAGIIEGVLDDPHLDPVLVLSPMASRQIHFSQVRSIGKTTNRPENKAIFDSCQQMRVAIEHLLNGLITEETAVPKQQHAFIQVAQQAVGHGDLPNANGFDQAPPQHMGSRFAQRQNPYLRKRSWSTTAARSAEDLFVLRRIGKIQDKPVHGHQTQSAVEGSFGLGFGEQPHNCFDQGTKGRQADALSGLTQR